MLRNVLAGLIVLGAASACSTVHLEFGAPIEEATVAHLVPGESTLSEVLEVLGAPYDMAEYAGGYALIYEHLDLTEVQFGISGDAIGLNIIKAVYGKSRAGHSATIAVVRSDLVLAGVGTSSWDEKVGTAGGVQLVFDVQNVVDSEDLMLGHDALEWGAGCLMRLPSALNREHRADLYQRGAPLRTGQFTLELQDWRAPGNR